MKKKYLGTLWWAKFFFSYLSDYIEMVLWNILSSRSPLHQRKRTTVVIRMGLLSYF